MRSDRQNVLNLFAARLYGRADKSNLIEHVEPRDARNYNIHHDLLTPALLWKKGRAARRARNKIKIL